MTAHRSPRTGFLRVALLAALAAPGAPLAAQQRPADAVARRIRPEVVRAHVEFLADDALEGRAPGTHGGIVAARYLAAQFERLGLEPAGDEGTYFQRVPLAERRFTSSLELPGDTTPPLRMGDDFVLYVVGPDSAASVAGRVTFVGYGITAPEEAWDDYAGSDVKGKIVLALAGTPAQADSSLFRRTRRRDYGFRQYKVDQAMRHGAAGVLVVYRPGAVPVSWESVAQAWLGPQLRIETAAGTAAAGIAGWLNGPAAERIAARAGADLNRLADEAARPGVRARDLAVTLALSARGPARRTTAWNVVARLPGRGPLAREAVVLGAHYDHLGIGPPVNGDSIYNGAEDNASGTAGVLAVAEAFVTSGVRPARSIVFAAFDAEEAGLLGSEGFVQRPPLPLRRIAAMVALDVVNLAADTRDLSALGAELSSLGDLFARAAAAEGYRLTPGDAPIMRLAARENFFERSDHASFARAGVPVLFPYFGDDVIGRGPGSGVVVLREYLAERYHRPNDDLTQPLDYRAGARVLRVVARTLMAAADQPAQPRWADDAPYRAAGEARLGN